MSARHPERKRELPPAAPKIRVLLADKDPYVREGVRSCLSRNAKLKVVGEAATGTEVLATVKLVTPDVVVMNSFLPELDGLEASRQLRRLHPQIRVLILAEHRSKELVRDIVRSGASGYLSKLATPTELASAIERVHLGETFFTPEIVQEFFNDFVQHGGKVVETGPRPLSEREREVLTLIIDGLGNREVAARLNLSVRTVEKHRQRIMRKLGVCRATELLKLAVTRGWVNLNPLEGV